MIKCPLCNDEICKENFLFHIKVNHIDNRNSEITCPYTNCQRHFQTIYAYKKHAILVHAQIQITDKIEAYSDELECEIGSETHIAVKIVNDAENNIVDVSSDHSEYAHDFLSQITDSIENNELYEKEFSNFVFEKTALFIAKLYAKISINRESALEIIKTTKDLYSSIFTPIIKKKYKSSEYLSHMLSVIENSFINFKTEHLIFQFFIHSGCLILPRQIHINSYLKNGKVRGKSKIVQSFDDIQNIPIKTVLTTFLTIPGVLDSIFMNINSCKESEHITVFNSELYKSLSKNFEKKLLLPLVLYNDDVEINNPLSSRKGFNKLGMVYYSILGLPNEYSSQLENIFLFQIHKSKDHKNLGNQQIFKNIVEQLVDLVNNGITLNYNGKNETIYFLVFEIISDNLGANTILGFSKSFNSLHYCRICTADKNIAAKMTRENADLLRNLENYKDDSESTSHGVQESCIFHKIPYFHVTQNTCVDFMHDLLEGVCRYNMGRILYSLIYEKQFFSLEVLNSRIAYFDKSLMEDSNILPVISVDAIIKKNLVITASEMNFLVHYLCLLIGDLVSENSLIWQLYLLLREIVNIINAPAVNNDIIERLTNVIHEHHLLYMKLFQETLKPKYHILIHYPQLMRKLGPLIQFSCIRYEAKHKIFKDIAKLTSKQNSPYTLSVKHQLQMSYRFFRKEGFKMRLEFGNKNYSISEVTDFNKFKDTLPLHLKMDKCICVNWVRINGTLYKKCSIISLKSDDVIFNFGKISYIILDKDTNEIYFSYKTMQVMRYNDHLCSYEVQEINNWGFLKQKDLADYIPLTSHLLSNGKIYVPGRI